MLQQVNAEVVHLHSGLSTDVVAVKCPALSEHLVMIINIVEQSCDLAGAQGIHLLFEDLGVARHLRTVGAIGACECIPCDSALSKLDLSRGVVSRNLASEFFEHGYFSHQDPRTSSD